MLIYKRITALQGEHNNFLNQDAFRCFWQVRYRLKNTQGEWVKLKDSQTKFDCEFIEVSQ